MATYRELKAQMVELEMQMTAARALEARNVLAEIRSKVAEYEFSERDIFGQRRVEAGERSRVMPKYRDPDTGMTWSGRGRPPEWIKSEMDRERFLIPSTES